MTDLNDGLTWQSSLARANDGGQELTDFDSFSTEEDPNAYTFRFGGATAADLAGSSLLETAKSKFCCTKDEDAEQADEGKSAAVQASANFHQAAAVYLLGGSTANYTGCKPENVSRCTNEEMRAH